MFFVWTAIPGKLRLIEASTTGYNELSSAQVLSGQEVWAPWRSPAASWSAGF